MKLLVVSQYFYPEQFCVNDICRELVRRGHSVTVLTGLPNSTPAARFTPDMKEKRTRRKPWMACADVANGHALVHKIAGSFSGEPVMVQS